MLIFLAGVAAVGAAGGLPWLVSAVALPRWIRSAHWRMQQDDVEVSSRLHVVVPARDEAATIGACASALSHIRGPSVSLVVVDDSSSDGTALQALTAWADESRGEVVAAPARPAGWSGKAWACSTGSVSADDVDWYLFVDADVIIDPRLPGALIRLAGQDLDLVSVFGRWALPTIGVAWLMPALGWLIRGSVDPVAVRAGRTAFANGQVLLFRGAHYRALGGHAAVQADVLDDVGLAKASLAAGGRAAIVWMPNGFLVHAYGSIKSLMRGYRKNLVAGLGSPTMAIVAGLAVLWAYMGPVVGLVAGLGVVAGGAPVVGAALSAIAGVSVGLCIGLRLALDRLEGRTGALAPLQPLAGVPLAALFWWSAFSRRADWKGRRFDRGVAE